MVLLYFKQYSLIYPLGYFEIEMVAIFALLAVHYLRLFIGSRGNKCEESFTTLLFILLTLLCAIGNAYFIAL